MTTEIIDVEQHASFISTQDRECPNCKMCVKADYLIENKCAFCMNGSEWEKYWRLNGGG